MKDIARQLQQLVTCSIGVMLLSSCSTWTDRYRPIDIDANMPRASELIDGVQLAIDSTDDGKAWDPNGYFKAADEACSTKTSSAAEASKLACNDAYATARTECAKVSGVSGPSLCADYFRQAMQTCVAAAQPEPSECGLAKLIAPPRISEATLQLTAAVDAGAGASVEYLTLLSAKASRKLGRKHTLEITLIPRPAIQRALEAASRGEGTQGAARTESGTRGAEAVARSAAFMSDPNFLQNAASLHHLAPAISGKARATADIPAAANAAPSALADSLAGALKVALNAALVDDETAPKKRQLTLKRMFYQFEIDYTRDVGGGLKWTVAPISAAVEASRGSQAGNIVTIEVVR